MNKLACCVVSSYPESFVVGTLPNDACAEVKPVAEWAFVRGGVSISHGDLAVIKMAVYEFNYGGALHRSRVELFVYGAAHHL